MVSVTFSASSVITYLIIYQASPRDTSIFLYVAQAARCWATGWMAQVSEGWKFFFGPEVHSASYKMSTKGFPQG